MKKFTLFLLFVFCSILVEGCTTTHEKGKEILVIYSEAPVKALDGIVEEGLAGIQNTTVTLTWQYLSIGETVNTIEIIENYNNEENALNAWRIRRENRNVITRELSGNSYAYGNINTLDRTYEEMKKLIEENDSWEIILTSQDAVEKYIQERIPDMYLKGDRFLSTYRILDEISSEDSVIVFTHILCEWISSTGEVVSGGAVLISITFDKMDDTLVYKNDRIFDEQEISLSSEITQKVKDSYSSNGYFREMQTEIEKEKPA